VAIACPSCMTLELAQSCSDYVVRQLMWCAVVCRGEFYEWGCVNECMSPLTCRLGVALAAGLPPRTQCLPCPTAHLS
jgi:hypothetical protein